MDVINTNQDGMPIVLKTCIEYVLKTDSFGDMLVKVVLNCIKLTHLSVIWNCNQLESFTPSRDLRQGDPPYHSYGKEEMETMSYL